MMKFVPIVLLVFVFASCKKPEDRSCFKSAGEETTISYNLEVFDRIFVGPNINLVLVQDTVHMMKITGGAHLVNFISSDISDGQLNLVNRNKCNFLRSYKHELTVELHVVQLSEIQFEGTKPLRCETAIVGNNLSVFIRDGAGEVSLNVDCNNLNCVVTNGWGNFDISGTTQNLDLNIRSNGFGSTYNLSVEQQLRVISNTSGLLKVNADGADCMIQMQSVGDIWFIGTPANVSLSDQGEGEWIDKN